MLGSLSGCAVLIAYVRGGLRVVIAQLDCPLFWEDTLRLRAGQWEAPTLAVRVQ